VTVLWSIAAVALGLALSGCSSDEDTASEPGSGATLRVLAASSLTESFDELAEQFEADNPGTTVNISYGSSSTLATQVIDGAPADVLATASPGSMAPVSDDGLTEGQPEVFATNSAAIAAPTDNPANLATLDDLAGDEVKVAVCVDTAPCGSVASDLFAEADLDVTPVTQEVDVKSVLAKVTTGEVDAGVVYQTDILAAGDNVYEVEIPAGISVTTDYLIATLAEAPELDLAQEFAALVTSAEGQAVLTKAGFQVP
jgi:molybdate transport system substrate-binding protein